MYYFQDFQSSLTKQNKPIIYQYLDLLPLEISEQWYRHAIL